MYIAHITIDNFKSFNGKSEVPFETGFTTISGPNGSGKSNIVDSVLFCLGLSTSRTMRAEKLTDFINNQSRRKFCQVTILFQKETADLKAEGLEEYVPPKAPDSKADDDTPSETTGTKIETPTEKQDIRPDQLEVSRRVRVTNSGPQSVYTLNGRTSTLTEIHETLSRYHVSPGSFNVMMQGDVQGFVSMSATERRKIIDEIAGIGDFDRKIEQAQKELSHTSENIERHTLLLHEIDDRLTQLSAERKTALKYQQYKEEKHEWDNKRLVSKYASIKKSLDACNANMAEAQQDKTNTKSLLEALQTTLVSTRNELSDVSERVKQKGEDQYIALKTQIEGLKGHVARKEDGIQFNDSKIAENLAHIETMNNEIARLGDNSDTLGTELDGFHQQIKELQDLYDNEANAYKKLTLQLEHMSQATGDLAHQRHELKETLRTEDDVLAKLNRDHMALQSQKDRQEYEANFKQTAQAEAFVKRDKLVSDQTRLGKELKDLELEKSAIEAQWRHTQTELTESQEKLQQTDTQFAKYNREFMQLDAQKRAYDDLNYARPVEMVMKAGIDGIHGPLGDLCQADGDVALAVEIALGGRIQNVVVDDDQAASEAIGFLKQQRGGRATFLPMNRMSPARRLGPMPRGGGMIDYAINLVQFDPQYQHIFAYALGETLVVEDMDAARDYLRKHRMVTLDGTMLEKTGAMTGGSQRSKGQGRLAKAAKVDEQLDNAKQHMKQAMHQKKSLQEKIDRLTHKQHDLRESLIHTREDLSDCAARLKSVVDQLNDLQATLGDVISTSASFKQSPALTASLNESQHAIDVQQKKVDGMNQELDALESKLPTEELAELQKNMADIKFQMDYYDAQLRNVQADVQSKTMERDYQSVGVNEYKERIEKTLEHNKNLAKEKAAFAEEITVTAQQINQLQAQTLDLDDELKGLQAERDAVQGKLLEQEKQKNTLEQTLNQLGEQLVAVQQRKQQLATELKGVEATLTEHSIHTDDLDLNDLPSEDDVLAAIEKLSKKMATMEPVNMRAIQDYDDVQIRRHELGEKIETLANETESLNVRIAGYEELKLASFKKSFDHVDTQFKAIFNELTDGVGRLLLSNPESPLTSGMTLLAQPRGKKIQRLEAMSGGEKSLTSLAFVFALQRCMPAPFYALDEVDMNLDGVNVEKLATMIHRESGKGAQFIVVSLRKPMLEQSERTIGVTQQHGGRTKVTGIKIRKADDASEADLKKANAAGSSKKPLTDDTTEPQQAAAS